MPTKLSPEERSQQDLLIGLSSNGIAAIAIIRNLFRALQAKGIFQRDRGFGDFRLRRRGGARKRRPREREICRSCPDNHSSVSRFSLEDTRASKASLAIEAKGASMKRILVTIPLCISPLLATAAEQMTGNELLNICESNAPEMKAACEGYVAGFLRGTEIGRIMERTKRGACLPEGSTVGQMKMLFVKLAHEHPENLHDDAGMVLGPMLVASYPCDDAE